MSPRLDGVIVRYSASSLADIAESFRARSVDQLKIAEARSTKTEKIKYAASAATWDVAASILDKTTIKAETSPVMTREQFELTMKAMRAYGGGFVNHLVDLYEVADAFNTERLNIAFADILRHYGPDSEFYKAIIGRS